MGRPIYRIIKLIVGLLMILIKNYELRIKNYKKTKKNKISKRIKKFNNWENCFKRKMKKRKTRRRWKLWRGKEKRLKKRINGEAKKKANWMWIVWLLGSLLMGVFSFGIYIFYKEILIDLPDIEKIYTPPPMSSKIVDRDGSLLYKFYEDENRTWIPLSKIPQTLVWATISIEDKDFYRHSGFSLKGVFQAILYNLRKDQFPPRGGSTITQQVVKNVFLGSEKTWKRKLKEAVLAIALEWKLPKNEILERYFNQVAYGGESYGVQEASLKYFDKNVWEINLAEAAFLAGLPAAPSSYSPYGKNPEFALLRQKRVLDEMVKAGFINEEIAKKVSGEEIKIKNNIKNIEFPHFVFYVKKYLEEKLNFENIEKSGLRIVTSLDREKQLMAEKIVKEEIAKVLKLKISNGAVLIIDTKNGDILSMVGSKDYYTNDVDGKFNVTVALRQPGSSIKPINYLLALKKGWTLSSLIDDDRITYQIAGQDPYSPQNYNGKYMGTVTLKIALASSLNIPSVKLLEKNGVMDMIDLAEEMGITSWKDRSRFGLSLALGAGEVKMTELAEAYSIFANEGKKNEVNPILRVENYLGERIYEKETDKNRVVSSELAFLINEALSDDTARAPIFGFNSKLKIPERTVAVKTGTTNNLKDNWCIGWTPSVLVASWVGNNDGSPMSWVASGISGATPIWNRIMTEILENREEEKWQMPEGIVKTTVCGKEGYFVKGTENGVRCLPKTTPTPTIN